MILIDSHCHLNSKELLPFENDLIKRAYEAGIKKFIIVGCDLDDSLKAVELANKYNQYASIGIHPHETERYKKNIPSEFYEAVHDKSIIAIGEIGLDFHYMHSPADIQKEFFELQLNFAREFNKPVILHIREAMSEALNIMKNYNDLKFLFHCYSGGTEFLERSLEFKSLLAFGGALTWKGKASENLREAFLKTPLNRIIFETDCPYMAPAPFRGKLNEPSYVKYIYDRACEMLNIKIEELADIVENNIKNFFMLQLI